MPLDNLSQLLRIGNIFAPQHPIMSDDPRNGGITGRGPRVDIFAPSRDMMARQGDMQPGQDTAMTPGRQTMPESMDVRSVLDELYKPETEMQDRYRQHIDTMPQRNQPGKLARIAAMFAPNRQEADKIMYAPFNREMGDWSTKADVYGRAATDESRFNRDQANFALQETSRRIQQQNANTAALKNQQIYETQVAKLEQQAEQANARLELMAERLNLDRDSRQNQLSFKEAQLDAQNARHAADLAIRDAQLANLEQFREESLRLRQELNDIARDRQNFAEQPVNEDISLETDDEGNVTGRNRTTYRGARTQPQGGNTGASNMVVMFWKDGSRHNIPKEKVPQALKDGFSYNAKSAGSANDTPRRRSAATK